MILSALLKPVEKCLNHYLAADAEKANALNALNNKIIHVYLSPLNFECYVIIDNTELRLIRQCNEPANTIIRGTPIALLSLLRDKNTVLPENVSITGDLHVIQTLKNIFASIDIDWEEKLSHYIGDVAAHIFCQKWRKLCEYQNYAAKSVTRSSREYLQEEIRCFPTREELTDFFDDIDHLRNSVDRLSARIDLLTQSET